MFAYVRVSTQKQGEGVSLEQQKEAIKNYAQSNNFSIVRWFEEKKTAAKHGRPEFTDFIKRLRKKEADGIIIHKIDRSARNLKDWAMLGDLIDDGVLVQFAHDNLDLTARGGRLSADIQAIIAADYVRNLREETIKGLYGRLRQGLYPFTAPVGYIDNGKGKVKTIDRTKAPLVKKAFILYATGDYSLRKLRERLAMQGLTNLNGNPLCKNGISKILRNSFYTGVITIKKSGETFTGKHTPIISVKIFKDVQRILDGKAPQKKQRRYQTLSNFLRCEHCNYAMSGEKQKGHIYYRCHTKSCPTKSLREDRFEEKLRLVFEHLDINNTLKLAILEKCMDKNKQNTSEVENKKQSLQLTLKASELRLSRLTDLLIDETIDKSEYLLKKASLVSLIAETTDQLNTISLKTPKQEASTRKILEPCEALIERYFNGETAEKREILRNLTPNLRANENGVAIKLYSPYAQIANCSPVHHCAPPRDDPRTFAEICPVCVEQSSLPKSEKCGDVADEVVGVIQRHLSDSDDASPASP